jgi:hypothetical protein
MEQEKMNVGARGDNQGAIDTKQELNERVDQALAKIMKTSRWSVVFALALITFYLWLSLYGRPFEPQIGYKMIIASVFALVYMILSIIDQLWASKFKHATRQEQLEGVLRYRKRGKAASLLALFFFYLYILVDIIYDTSGIGRIVFAAILFAIFVFVYWVTYDKSSVYKSAADLEDDVRELAKREQ